LAGAFTKLVDYGNRFQRPDLIGLPLLNMLATSNTDTSGNTNLLITLPVLATGVLYLVASFVDKRDDSAEEK
jgi:hypothetical protein